MDESYSYTGQQRLQILEESANFTEWMYSEIKPYLSGSILEVGSGIGTYAKKVAMDFKGNKIIASDVDSKNLQILKSTFEGNPDVSIIRLDISNKLETKNIGQKMDSIFCLNVLEHIKDDASAISNAYSLLNPGGKFTLLVPAYKFLFNSLDRTDGHFRRYTKKDITQKALNAGFKIKKISYFNSASIPSWYLMGTILKKSTINKNAMALFNSLVHFFRIFEKNILRNKIGISLIAILEKN